MVRTGTRGQREGALASLDPRGRYIRRGQTGPIEGQLRSRLATRFCSIISVPRWTAQEKYANFRRLSGFPLGAAWGRNGGPLASVSEKANEYPWCPVVR